MLIAVSVNGYLLMYIVSNSCTLFNYGILSN